MLYDLWAPPCTLYVIQCKTPRHFYVGTTYRHKKKRFAEHFAGWGCKWTRKHGCKRVIVSFSVPLDKASRYENDVWTTRGSTARRTSGAATIVDRGTDAIPDWCLPKEFGGDRPVDWGITG